MCIIKQALTILQDLSGSYDSSAGGEVMGVSALGTSF